MYYARRNSVARAAAEEAVPLQVFERRLISDRSLSRMTHTNPKCDSERSLLAL